MIITQVIVANPGKLDFFWNVEMNGVGSLNKVILKYLIMEIF